MAKGRRTYGRRRINRSRRQRGGFCFMGIGNTCPPKTGGVATPESGPFAGLQQGAKNAADGVGDAFSTLGKDLGFGAKEGVPTSAQYGDAVNRMQASPQYGNGTMTGHVGGRRRRRRTMRRRRRSSRRY
jgi:hypothetical protein